MKTLLVPLLVMSLLSNTNAREYDLRFKVTSYDCSSNTPPYYLLVHQLHEKYRTELDLYNWAHLVHDGYTWEWERSTRIRCEDYVYFRCQERFKLEIVPALSFRKKFNPNTKFRVDIFIYGHDVGYIELKLMRPRIVNLRAPL